MRLSYSQQALVSGCGGPALASVVQQRRQMASRAHVETFRDHPRSVKYRRARKSEFLSVLESEITCALPRGQCRKCRQVFTVRAPWEGRSRGLSQEFEAFALILMREMPVKKAGEILGETDHKLWRMLFAHVDAAWSVNIMRKSEMPLEQERPGLDFSRGASGLAGEDRAHAARGKRAESKN